MNTLEKPAKVRSDTALVFTRAEPADAPVVAELRTPRRDNSRLCCRGIGRQCVDEALRIVRAWPADALQLDAYDAHAGAGPFYFKCGFREVGRTSYRSVPLIYYEHLV